MLMAVILFLIQLLQLVVVRAVLTLALHQVLLAAVAAAEGQQMALVRREHQVKDLLVVMVILLMAVVAVVRLRLEIQTDKDMAAMEQHQA
jgi:uncharacterized membrane protein